MLNSRRKICISFDRKSKSHFLTRYLSPMWNTRRVASPEFRLTNASRITSTRAQKLVYSVTLRKQRVLLTKFCSWMELIMICIQYCSLQTESAEKDLQIQHDWLKWKRICENDKLFQPCIYAYITRRLCIHIHGPIF